MGQGTTSSTFPDQGKPGTGPGQQGQEPQHQAEHGMQPILDRKEDNEKESDPVNQAEQNKTPNDPDQSGAPQPEKDPQRSGAF